MTRQTGIAVSEAFAEYLDDLRETAHFPRCASLRSQGPPGLNSGITLS